MKNKSVFIISIVTILGSGSVASAADVTKPKATGAKITLYGNEHDLQGDLVQKPKTGGAHITLYGNEHDLQGDTKVAAPANPAKK